MDGKEVGHGDREYYYDVEHVLPVLYHGREHLHEDGAQREGGGTLRDDRQVARNGGGGSLVGIGCPEVERHERNLEAQATEEEHHTYDGKWRNRNLGSHVVKVEGAHGGI